MKNLLSYSRFLLAFTLGCLVQNQDTKACTRVVYQGPNGTVITARSMDWRGEIPADLWAFPKGIERTGEVGPMSIKWKSKYGSVATSSFDVATSDGMNEKGLVGNTLWLVESKYPEFKKDGNKKGLAISLWLQYTLDNFATVAEAVADFRKGEFDVFSDFVPGTNMFTTMHLSLSDATGDNAILEYINGKLVIHHDRSYTVMTNSPIFDQQLAINQYWKDIPGTIGLPGTNRAADRFVRASYYINAIPQTDNTRVAVASVFSVIRNCSVPYGISSPTEPNISNTQWRTVADHKNLVYYFENVLTPNVVWVDFKNLDLKEGAAVRKLALSKNETYNGESSKNFVVSKPLKFLGLSN
ncbi:linear amide C-N hydrolase [Spirosoma montaniterrae]|uniref:Choloylglycine hydrolase n=1 Tax=Spirosoma montaniterrae TaxID=1178516 RepID=A0A1P9X300_9BACT|nr:linear amide C-N hydrolase [Spirosoma montaniterrae]AQG81981.1 choloylglycine hydrolase [Spirosoma montaniterrae]